VWIAPVRKHKLDLFDLVPCLRPAYDSGFSRENNIAAFAEIGFNPYNSILYWTLLAAETKKKEITTKVGLKPEDMAFSIEGMLLKSDPRARGAVAASPSSPSTVEGQPAAALGGTVAVQGGQPVESSRSTILKGRQKAARAAAMASSLSSEKCWFLGPPTRGKGAALVANAQKNKNVKALDKKERHETREKEVTKKRDSYIAIGSQVKEKLAALGATPSLAVLSDKKNFTNDQLIGLIYLKGDRGVYAKGTAKDKLAAKLHSLLDPNGTPGPQLLLENGPLGIAAVPK
jgi:hypothetical protein